MFIKVILALVVATSALAEESANLRGAQPVEHSHGFANQQNNLKKQEAALNALLKNTHVPDAVLEQAAEKTATEAAPKILDYSGGAPSLTFDGYMVSRFHANSDCTGPGN
jgi:hypothetical protein